MDEREAAHNRGFPTRKFLETDFEVAGARFCCSGNDSPSVAILQAASKDYLFFRKHSLAVISESTCSPHSCKSGSLLERRGCRLRERLRGRRTRRQVRAEWNGEGESL
jgi:hypothetical protein